MKNNEYHSKQAPVMAKEKFSIPMWIAQSEGIAMTVCFAKK
jgi:hypothetical protein